MSVPSLLLPFLLVVAVLTVSPGPDMVLVLRNGALGGAVGAWRTGLGCCAGIAVHAGAAVLGLAGLLAASAAAFTTVKLAGAAYLVWLGASALWHSRRGEQPGTGPDAAPDRAPDSASHETAPNGSYFRQGLLSNLLNPKIALLFLTLLPQFVAAGEPRVGTTAVLAATFLAVAVLWWRLFSLAVGGLGALLARPGVRRALDRTSGVVLVGLGLRVALEQR